MKKSRIMYLENKEKESGESPRIGRVDFSKTGRTIYYRGLAFRSLKGQGIIGNYYEIETGQEYWISGCRKDGNDTLFGGIVEIDNDVRKEYWTTIRQRPNRIDEGQYVSPGKR